MRQVMQRTQQSGGDRLPLAETSLELCETCLERGRERPGTHPVGAGFLCDGCFKGEGSSTERAGEYLPPGEQESRRSYRRRNLERFREYLRLYRARQRMRTHLVRDESGAAEDS